MLIPPPTGPPQPLPESWRVEIPGTAANQVLHDPSTSSLFVSDGWGVAYPSLRLHRLSPLDGRELASVRTRHQSVFSLLRHEGMLWSATDRRLTRHDPKTLDPLQQWDRGIVRFSDQMVAAGGHLLTANWQGQTVALVDLATGEITRRRGLPEMTVVPRGDDFLLLSRQGGSAVLDPASTRLTDRRDAPPVTEAVEVGGRLWCLHGSRLLPLDDPAAAFDIAGSCRGMSAAEDGTLWVVEESWLEEGGQQRRQERLLHVDPVGQRILGVHLGPRDCRYVTLDAAAGTAWALTQVRSGSGMEIPKASLLHAFTLP